ncbi:MAG: hypothetical protein RRY79_05775 [Clostridia bacterium]
MPNKKCNSKDGYVNNKYVKDSTSKVTLLPMEIEEYRKIVEAFLSCCCIKTDKDRKKFTVFYTEKGNDAPFDERNRPYQNKMGDNVISLSDIAMDIKTEHGNVYRDALFEDDFVALFDDRMITIFGILIKLSKLMKGEKVEGKNLAEHYDFLLDKTKAILENMSEYFLKEYNGNFSDINPMSKLCDEFFDISDEIKKAIELYMLITELYSILPPEWSKEVQRIIDGDNAAI